MKVNYVNETWNNKSYRFFRFKAWMKALNLAEKLPKRESEKNMKDNARRAA